VSFVKCCFASAAVDIDAGAAALLTSTGQEEQHDNVCGKYFAVWLTSGRW